MTEERQLNLFGDSNLETTSAQPPLDFDAIPTRASIPIPRGTYDRIEQLAQHCQHCQRCDLCNSRTHAVVGRGNPHAAILLIGEGPGQNEDEQGLPFVGKSGQLLEKILASVQLDTERDLYIANMVKCLSGDTRVLTRNGYQAIAQLANTRWAGEVRCVDRDNRLVWRKITGWYRSPLAGRTLYRLVFPGETEGATLTADHLLLTQRGWIAAEDLQESDRVATGTPKRDRLPATAYTGNSAVSKGTGSTATLVPAPSLATDWKPLRKHPLPPTSDTSVVYCIDVEETANFVTPAGVVRNCRPPGNRTPSPKEIEACKPYLLEQIRLIDPQIILFTGATALRGLTGDKRGITKVRGQWIEWEKRLCMAIFHPAYLLRNPSRDKGSPKWLMWQDIQEVRAKLDQLRSLGS